MYCGAANAQAPETVLIDAGPCLQLESVLERYSCYEKQALDAQQAQELRAFPAPDAASAPVPSPAEQGRAVDTTAQPQQVSGAAATPTLTGEESFGLPAATATGKEVVEITSSVKALREVMPGRLVITLENGQIWRQMTSERYNLLPGDQVRIYPTRWGSNYRMTGRGLGSFIQVQRTH